MTKYSIRDLFTQPSRTMLTIFGIVIGIAFMVSLSSLAVSMKTEIEGSVQTVMKSAVFVNARRLQGTIPTYVSNTLQKMEGVVSVIPVVVSVTASGGKALTVVGMPVSDMQSFVPVVAGKLPSSDNASEFMTTEPIATSFNLALNDTLKVTTLQMMTATNLKLVGMTELVGIFQGLAAGSGMVAFTGIGTAQQMFNMEGYATIFIVRITQPGVAQDLKQRIEATFPKLNVMLETDLVMSVGNIISSLDALVFAVSLIGLSISGLSVMNSIATNVVEKRREIGVLKSIGAKNWQVFYIFVFQGLLFGITGGILGGGAGIGITYLILNFVNNVLSIGVTFPFIIDTATYFRGFTVALILGILASIVPSWNATRVRPVEALRYE